MIGCIETDSDISVRKEKGYPEIGTIDYNSASFVFHTKEFLEYKDNEFPADSFRMCDSLLPIGIILIECEDGECWLGVQIYPLHYDTRINDKLGFAITDKQSELWRIIEEQFDHLWNDKYFREKACRKALEK